MTSYAKKEDYDTERELALMIARLSRVKADPIEPDYGITDGKQRHAVHAACNNSLSVLTGFPGTGKTTSLRQIVKSFQSKNLKGAVLCPYGRSVSRAKEAILGTDGKIDSSAIAFKTIHSALKLHNEEEKADENNPLRYDYILLDEFGTIGDELSNSLFKAIDPNKTRVVISGDPNQLKSIGKGDVLSDIILSEVAETTTLTEVHRQAQNSGIIVNAIRVLEGKMPVNKHPETGERFKDCDFIEVSNAATGAQSISRKVVTDLPLRKNVNALKDIQVITPGKKGNAGVESLTKLMSYKLNPSNDKGFCGFKVGDKVINRKNNFDLGIVNGDIGYVTATTNKNLEVTFDGECGKDLDGKVVYSFDKIGDLNHSIALTIHLTIGCEFDITVIPIFTEHAILLNRNLLFTAITRSKKHVVVYYEERAMKMALSKRNVKKRETNLDWMIREYKKLLDEIATGG